MSSAPCGQAYLSRRSVKATFDCFSPAAQPSLNKVQSPLPFQPSSRKNLEWAAAFLDHAGQLIATQEQTHATLKHNYEHALHTISHNNTDITNLKADKRRLLSRNADLEAAIVRKDKAYHDIDAAFDLYRTNAKKNEEALSNKIREHEKDLSKAIARVASLEAKLESANKKAFEQYQKERRDDIKDHAIIDSLHEQLADANRKISLLNEKGRHKDQELVHKEQELSEANNKIKTLTEEIAKLRSIVTQKTEESQRLQVQIEQLTATNNALTAETKQLHEQLTERSASLEQALMDRADALAKIVKLEEEIETQKLINDTLSRQLEAQREQSQRIYKELQDTSEAIIHELSSQLQALQAEYEGVQALLAKTNRLLTEALEDDAADKQTIVQLSQDKLELQQRLMQTKADLAAAATEAQNAKALLDQTKADLAKAVSDDQADKDKIELLESIKNNLLARIAKNEEEDATEDAAYDKTIRDLLARISKDEAASAAKDAAYEAKVKDLSTTLDKTQNDLELAKANDKADKDKISELESKEKSLLDDISKLKEEDVKEDAAYKETINGLKGDLDNVKAALTKAKSDDEADKDKIELLESIKNNLLARIAKNELEDATEDAGYDKTIERQKTAIEELQAELKAAALNSEAIAASEAAIAEANKSLADMKSQVEEATKRAADAHVQAVDSEAARQAAEQTVAEVLARPIALIGDLSGAIRDCKNDAFSINCPFPVTLFGSSSSIIYVSTNGLLTLDKMEKTLHYKELSARSIWVNNIDSNHTLAPFWADLCINKGAAQGIFYKVTGKAGTRTLEVEWYMSRQNRPQESYHFSVVIEESRPNFATFKYFSLSDSKSCSIGTQGPKSRFSKFSYMQAKALPGLQVVFNTNNDTFEASTFQLPASTVKPAPKAVDVKPANAVTATVTEILTQ